LLLDFGNALKRNYTLFRRNWLVIFAGSSLVRLDIRGFAKENSAKILLTAPLLAFAVPLLWLYLLNPVSFDNLWKGRTFELFFVWLILLELILGWESLKKKMAEKQTDFKLFAILSALLLPTIYVIASNYLGVNAAILEFSKQNGVYWYNDMPVAIEYLVFAVFFSLTAFLTLGMNGLKDFSIPIVFSAIIGSIFIIDSVYPNDQFTPFQLLVPATTILASNTLSFMGYKTVLDMTHGNLPQLTVTDPNYPHRTTTFGVAWQCAGIESLLLFAVIIALFLKRMPISWQAKVGFFAFGAVVTYLINVLRIVSIFLWSLGGGDVNVFHQTYGPLFPIAWIVSYPLIVLGSVSLWGRIRNKNKQGPAEIENPASDMG
jgi:exosortase/archaeosortase family protein